MHKISLNQHIRLTDLNEWVLADKQTLTFKLTKSASFDPGVEGIAIGALHHIVQLGISINVKCTFQPFNEDGDLQGPLNSLFGIHLLFSAKEFENAEEVNIRPTLINEIWEYIQKNNGQIGNGKKQSIIFRDPDNPIPECLQGSLITKFPYPKAFKDLLDKMSEKLAGSGGTSTLPSEDSIKTFLYEAAYNAHEHGRSSFEGTTIRGIILEKFIFNSPNELKERETLSKPIREYMARAWSSGSHQRSFLAATVSDVGLGIQNTLPSLENEDSWNRLNRAFKSETTKKPTVPDKDTGEGLPRVLKAACNLNAYMIVASGDLLGIRDFTIHNPDNNSYALDCCLQSAKKIGTSITVIWPIILGRGSQIQLFP